MGDQFMEFMGIPPTNASAIDAVNTTAAPVIDYGTNTTTTSVTTTSVTTTTSITTSATTTTT